MDSSLPVFIDIPEKTQATEIRQYLISAGADIPNSKENIHEEISCLLDAADNWLKSACDADLEAMMNSFISLILVCGFDSDKLTKKFCNKMSEIGANESNALLRIKILNNLFTGLAEDNNLCFDVYISQVRLAAKFNQTHVIKTSMKEVKEWLQKWNVTTEQKRTCYRELHACLREQLRNEEATKMMLELLSTFTEESASEAKVDAENCIKDFISRPDVFMMDNLLSLKPVQALAGSPWHQLLTVFVSGTLQDYLDLYNQQKDFVDANLDHKACVSKMSLLTFLTMASQQSQISFADLTQAIQVDVDHIEDFIVEAIQNGLVHAKIDQVNEMIVIRSCSRRTFSEAEWQELRSKMQQWKENLATIRSSLEQVVVRATSGGAVAL
jgi:translation initiation factor 3 subunit M